MFHIGRVLSWFSRSGQRCNYAVFPAPDALEQFCSEVLERPFSAPVQEPLFGSKERERLCHELTSLCVDTPRLSVVVGSRMYQGVPCTQYMPFQYNRAAAYYYHAKPQTIELAMKMATGFQRTWERYFIDERCTIIESAANLIAGTDRTRIVAAAMVGQAMTAIQAEYNISQLVDYMRFGCMFMRDLTKSRCVMDGGEEAYNRNQYHGLEGFWAAITPCDSFALASQLAITPLIMGNCVLWKPSNSAVLACQRVFECLRNAGLPSEALSFVPAAKMQFLSMVTADRNLAGISFAGTTRTLEHIWTTVGSHISSYARFPRIVGTGSGKNFHIVHSSADIPVAVACTVRAAFEMAGQKTFSCSRVFVEQSVLNQFLTSLKNVVKTLFVSHPLDYRCFMSALISREAYDKVVGFLKRVKDDNKLQLVCGGRYDDSVGYFVEPTVILALAPDHELMCEELRGPVLAVCAYPDKDLLYLEKAVAQAPYAITGSIFAQELEWCRWAVGALRDCATTLHVNERCSELRPAQSSAGGARKSGSGAKAGSISYLLHFGTERSVREARQPSPAVTYSYMEEAPPQSRA